MLRWTRRIFTLISFLLLAQSLALWERSYVLTDFINHQTVTRWGSTAGRGPLIPKHLGNKFR